MPTQGKLRTGVRVTGDPSIPLILEKSAPKQHNTLIGDDPAQIRFAEHYLSHAHFCTDACDEENHYRIKCVEVESIQDETVLGKDEPLLLRVGRARQIDLSSKVKANIGIWALAPITRGSDGANAIVRFAASLLDLERPNRDLVEKFGEAMVKQMTDLSFHKEVEDVFAAIWSAAWLLTGPEPPPFKPWPRPWHNHLTWFPRGTNPNYRLNALYKELVVYVFAREGDEAAARKIGRFKPKEFNILKNLRLHLQRVFDSIIVLSKWRMHKSNPYICALKLAKIWEMQ